MVAHRDTRRRFEQWARNPQCEANAISAVHGISMALVVEHEGGRPTMGQSPFAIQRGQSFEKDLFRQSGERLRVELVRKGVVPDGPCEFVDLRLRMSGGKLRDLDEAKGKTTQFLLGAAAKSMALPVLVAGATVTIPGKLMLPEAMLIIDALVIRAGSGVREALVGEVKTFPDRAGYTDAKELATARAQAGVYVHGLRLVLAELGVQDRLSVSSRGFLVFTRPGYNMPSVRADEDLHWQAERARRGFEKLHRVAELEVPAVPEDHLDRLRAVTAAPTNYSETCTAFCDRASLCRAAGLKIGHAAVLGDAMVQFLAGVNLHRAVELLAGAKPKGDVEVDLLRRLHDSDPLEMLR